MFNFKPQVAFKEIASNIYLVNSVSEDITEYKYDDIVTAETVIKAMKDVNIAVTLENYKEDLVWGDRKW